VASVLEAVAELARTIAKERQSPFGGRGLTRSQVETLFLLAHRPPPMTPGRLARALRVTPGAVSQLLEPLREQGLVEQTPAPDDARSHVVALSAAAAAAVEEFELAVVQQLLPRFSALDDQELARLDHVLRRLTADA